MMKITVVAVGTWFCIKLAIMPYITVSPSGEIINAVPPAVATVSIEENHITVTAR